jgi:hypothetical protein
LVLVLVLHAGNIPGFSFSACHVHVYCGVHGLEGPLTNENLLRIDDILAKVTVGSILTIIDKATDVSGEA